MWEGVDNGGLLELDLRVEGDVEGEVFVGFFEGPRWWLAEPVQVRPARRTSASSVEPFAHSTVVGFRRRAMAIRA